MTHKLSDVPLTTICIEHYLFDLGYSVEKVSEIYGVDEESVRKIHDNYRKYMPQVRSNK